MSAVHAAIKDALRLGAVSFDAVKPESTKRSGEGAGTGHHRDGEGPSRRRPGGWRQ